ncbi:hypothetical protein BLX42_10745 [Pseudomonas sp. SG-MS2]|nr:hypothetical protein BLX42_10745 [Pseudomonas sp. SG-MS2]
MRLRSRGNGTKLLQAVNGQSLEAIKDNCSGACWVWNRLFMLVRMERFSAARVDFSTSCYFKPFKGAYSSLSLISGLFVYVAIRGQMKCDNVIVRIAMIRVDFTHTRVMARHYMIRGAGPCKELSIAIQHGTHVQDDWEWAVFFHV